MEFLNLVVLAGLTTLCYGQMPDSSGMSSVPMAPSPTTTVVDVTRSYRDSMSYQQVYMDVNDTTSIYNQTRRNRYDRFNCHQRSAEGTITNRVPNEYVLTIYVQMPVLHFLDVRYKTTLLNNLTQILGITFTNARAIDPDIPPVLCVDGYDQAFVGTFDEGLMLRVYHQPASGNRTRAEVLQRRFFDYSGPSLTTYEGLDAIQYATDNRLVRQSAVVIRTDGASWIGRVSMNIGGCRHVDPEDNYYDGRPLNIAEMSCRSLDDDERDDVRELLAENPNPINFYLEAGDYVFAVLGSIAVAIVLGLATLGYFIHPFFLA